MCVVVGSFDELAVDECGAGADERDQMRGVDPRQRAWAASMSLNAIASPAAREPGPRVTFVRCRTVAKVLSIGFVTGMKDPRRRRFRRLPRW